MCELGIIYTPSASSDLLRRIVNCHIRLEESNCSILYPKLRWISFGVLCVIIRCLIRFPNQTLPFIHYHSYTLLLSEQSYTRIINRSHFIKLFLICFFLLKLWGTPFLFEFYILAWLDSYKYFFDLLDKILWIYNNSILEIYNYVTHRIRFDFTQFYRSTKSIY